MNNWLHLAETLTEPAVLITVATVEGSGPRESGAKMLVTVDAQFDTIGGGHLEMRACNIAREMLDISNAPARLERFALGPSLGQCCGGVVHLAFERLASNALADLACLRQRLQKQEDSWRLIALDDTDNVTTIFNRHGRCVSPSSPLLHAPLEIQYTRACHVMRDRAGKRWLVDPCRAVKPHLCLFGAGHVGAAIVRALAELPCNITWVDEREDMFPAEIPLNVKIEATDTPEFIADHAPANTTFLVLTHSHVVDLCLSEHILQRDGNEWFGLIGSRTKRMQFEHRLAARGILPQKLAAMVCPIGIAGITGKSPAVIAASVAAQLLQVWETGEQSAKLESQPQTVYSSSMPHFDTA